MRGCEELELPVKPLIIKSPNRNNPTIASPGISGESKKSGYSLRKSGTNFLPQVFQGNRKTRGKPYIDYICVLFKVKKVKVYESFLTVD